MVAAYFAYLAAMGFARRPTVVWRVPIVSLLMIGLVSTIGMPHVMPLVYLLTGYWLPALMVRAPSSSLERRLLGFDHRLFGPHGLESFAKNAPRLLLEYFELAYLTCYAVVPIGFAWLVLAGFENRAGLF